MLIKRHLICWTNEQGIIFGHKCKIPYQLWQIDRSHHIASHYITSNYITYVMVEILSYITGWETQAANYQLFCWSWISCKAVVSNWLLIFLCDEGNGNEDVDNDDDSCPKQQCSQLIIMNCKNSGVNYFDYNQADSKNTNDKENNSKRDHW